MRGCVKEFTQSSFVCALRVLITERSFGDSGLKLSGQNVFRYSSNFSSNYTCDVGLHLID